MRGRGRIGIIVLVQGGGAVMAISGVGRFALMKGTDKVTVLELMVAVLGEGRVGGRGKAKVFSGVGVMLAQGVADATVLEPRSGGRGAGKSRGAAMAHGVLHVKLGDLVAVVMDFQLISHLYRICLSAGLSILTNW